MENPIPVSMDELLESIRDEWSVLMGVVDQLTPQQMVTPDAGGWSPKDNLSHIAHWERYLLLHYFENTPEAEAKGIDADTLKGLDEDGENAILFERNRHRSVDDVLKELGDVHAQVVSTLEQTSFSSLLDPVPSKEKQEYSVLTFVIGNTSAHYAEHRATIEKILKP